MKIPAIIALSIWLASSATAQTVYLAGDSTMARLGGNNGNSDGWGQYLSKYLTVPVVNNAIGGRSARSFTDEGRFTTIINAVKPGDFVIIEFGHNDGSAGAVDNGRQDAVGDSYDTTATVTTSDGKQVLIHTFNYYVQNAVNAIKAKGGIPIVSSQTPNNTWQNGVIAPGGRFQGYAQLAASRTGVAYVDHYLFTAKAFNALGETQTTTFYPIDHTHTTAAGADVVAQAFVRGLSCGSSALKAKINTSVRLGSVPSTC